MEDVLTTTVPLKRPVTLNGATYASFTMREALVDDQLAITRPDMSQADLEIALIARLAGVPVEVIRQVRLTDYRAIQMVIANFPYPPETPSAPQSAASPSPSADSL